MKTEETTSPSPTILADGRRRWIYPDRRSGKFSRWRGKLAFFLILIYLGVPWIEVSNRPLLRFEALTGHVYVFGQVFRFMDTSYFVYVLILAGLSLFLITSVSGRMWCGFACPQTVFIDWLIRPLEEWIEGKAHHRKLADQKSLPFKLIVKKCFKHLVFFFISWLLANTLLLYFVHPQQLKSWLLSNPREHWDAFLVMSVVTLALYYDFAWFREQFCAFLCPYARLQSVMMDPWTPAVTYDQQRGEPRGKHNKGDCIDCDLCVRVCPTGIDIKNGLQLECIQCFRCVDACHQIMLSLKRPVGLISLKSTMGSKKNRFLNMKTIFLSFSILLICLGLLYKVLNRPLVTFHLVRQNHNSYMEIENHRLANFFELKAMHNLNSLTPLNFEIESDQKSKISLICGGCDSPLQPYEERKLALIITFDHDVVSKEAIFLIHKESGIQFRLPLIAPESVR